MRFYLSLLFLTTAHLFAQTNLVPNPGFEALIDVSVCTDNSVYCTDFPPINPTNVYPAQKSYWDKVEHWTIPDLDPATFCFQGCVGRVAMNCTSSNAHTGNNSSFMTITQAPGGEFAYITNQLTSTLNKGYLYHVEFYVHSAETVNPKKFGAYFSVDKVKECGDEDVIVAKPQITTTSLVSGQWTLISGTLTAEDSYQWITIGCFDKKSPGFSVHIDDVVVYEIGPGPGACCPWYKLYQNTDNIQSVTHVVDHIIAGNDVGAPGHTGNVTIQSGQNVTFKAGNRIELHGGFTVQGNFTATIAECNVVNTTTDEPIEILLFPTVMTPNGDGDNDQLCIQVKGATSYYVEVYEPSEFTNVIYKNSGPVTSNLVCVWDGTCNQSGLNCTNGCASGCSTITIGYNVTVKFNNCDHELISKDNPVNLYDNTLCGSCKKANPNPQDSSVSKGIDSTVFSNNRESRLQIPQTTITLAPNPSASGVFQLQVTSSEKQVTNVIVYNLLGETVYKSAIQNSQSSIDISSYSRGVYFVKVQSGEKLFMQKIVYQ